MRKIRIAGIGNVLMGDDGIGPFAIKVLEAHYEFQDGVELIDLGTPGLDLPIYLSGADAVILIDAAQFDAEAGTVRTLRRGDVLRKHTGFRTNPHSPALTESLFLTELNGELPSDFALIGVQGGRFEIGTGLSTPVRLVVPHVVDAVLRELNRLDVPWSPLGNLSGRPHIWWESDLGSENRRTFAR